MILPGNLSALYLERQHSHQKVDFLGARRKMKKVFCDKRTSGSPDLRSHGQRLSIPTIRAGPGKEHSSSLSETDAYISWHPLQFGRTGSCRSSRLPFPKLSTWSAPLDDLAKGRHSEMPLSVLYGSRVPLYLTDRERFCEALSIALCNFVILRLIQSVYFVFVPIPGIELLKPFSALS